MNISKQRSKEEIGRRIRELRIQKGLSQEELAKAVGYTSKNSRSTINKVEKGQNDITQSKLEAYAKALDVSVLCLLGYNTPSEYLMKSNEIEANNLFKIETKKFRLLGNIACGEPIFADEEIELYIEADANIVADFCLKAQGDSMTGARIYDGDIVFIRKQDIVDDGEIAAVLIDDEATLKRVYYDKEAGELSLYPENPKYKTMRFSGEELNQIRILGKAVAFQSNIK